MQLAVSAVGPDRPGLAASVTGVLLAYGANIVDAQMAVLSGRSTMMLLVDVPDDLDEEMFLGDLQEIGRDLDLDVVTANRVEPIAPAVAAEPSLVITVSGVDAPGLVHAIALQLARFGVNVTDLQTRRLDDGDDDALCAMMLEVVPPPGLDVAGLEEALRTIAGERALDVTVRTIPDV